MRKSERFTRADFAASRGEKRPPTWNTREFVVVGEKTVLYRALARGVLVA